MFRSAHVAGYGPSGRDRQTNATLGNPHRRDRLIMIHCRRERRVGGRGQQQSSRGRTGLFCSSHHIASQATHHTPVAYLSLHTIRPLCIRLALALSLFFPLVSYVTAEARARTSPDGIRNDDDDDDSPTDLLFPCYFFQPFTCSSCDRDDNMA